MKSNKKWRSIGNVVTLTGVLAFSSACGSVAVKDNSPAPSTSPAASSQSSQSPTPSATTTESTNKHLIEDFGTPAPAGKPVSSPNGSYMQSTISDDDPAMKLNPGLVDASLSSFDPIELEAAQRAIVKFTAEEGIDSRLNGDNNDVDAWWAENKSKLHPDYHNDMLAALKNREVFVLVEAWRDDYNGEYDYITDEKKTRIYDRKIDPVILWELYPGTIAIQMNVSYNIPVIPNVGKTGSGVQTTTGTMTYSATKDPTSGKWLIDGFDHDIKTTEG